LDRGSKGWRIVNYILKPAVMVVILAWLGSAGGFSGWMIWFSIAPCFCWLEMCF